MKMYETVSIGVQCSFCMSFCSVSPVHLHTSVLMSLPLNAVHVHLLNIVDPIHWIIYFLPSWWKLYKKRQKN